MQDKGRWRGRGRGETSRSFYGDEGLKRNSFDKKGKKKKEREEKKRRANRRTRNKPWPGISTEEMEKNNARIFPQCEDIPPMRPSGEACF